MRGRIIDEDNKENHFDVFWSWIGTSCVVLYSPLDKDNFLTGQLVSLIVIKYSVGLWEFQSTDLGRSLYKVPVFHHSKTKKQCGTRSYLNLLVNPVP